MLGGAGLFLPLCLSPFHSFSLPLSLSLFLFFSLSLSPSFYLSFSIYPYSVCLSIYLSICLFPPPSLFLCISRLFISLIYLSYSISHSHWVYIFICYILSHSHSLSFSVPICPYPLVADSVCLPCSPLSLTLSPSLFLWK